MSVNYTIIPSNQTGITPGTTFASNFTSSPPYTLTAFLVPIDPSQYYVSYEMFNISGGAPSAASQNIQNGNIYEYGDNDVNLPSYIQSVEISNVDYGLYSGNVQIIATIDPNWIVPSDLTGLFTTVLDIDGDAQPNPNTTASNQFLINLQLQNANSNCSVYTYVQADAQPSSSPSDYEFEAQETSSQSGSVLVTQGSNWTENSPLFNQLNFMVWFFIVPDDGYYLSKNNLSIVGNEEVSQTGVINYSCNSCPPPIGPITTVSSVSGPSYMHNFTPHNDPQVLLSYPSGNESYMYFSEIPSINTTDYAAGMLESVFMVDSQYPTQVAYSTTNPYTSESGGGTPWDNLTIPDNFCPEDWEDNVVIIMFTGLHNYVAGVNPPDLTFEISGEAMQDDGSQCGEFNFEIEEE